MVVRTFCLAAAVAISVPLVSAQPFRADATLLSRPDVRVAADALEGMEHLGGPLRRVHVAYERHRAEVAAGRLVGRFEDRVGFQAVRGDRVLIDAFAASAEALPGLAADLGAVGFEETGRYGHIVSGYLPLTAIGSAAKLRSLRAAHAFRARTGRVAARNLVDRAAAASRVGAVDGESGVALRADKARSLFGVDGSGLTIGVLSDSYDNLGGAAAGVSSGDLPSGITVVDDLDASSPEFPGIDEGRAMMELAFDVAPGVGFAFHTAFEGVASFASGIDDLIMAGADVVVDDVGYSAQPPFQDDIIAQAVDAAFAAGTPYFSAAGNAADAAYDGVWSDSGVDAMFDDGMGGTITGDLHDFDPGPGIDPFQAITTLSGPTPETISLAFHFDEPSGLASAALPSSNYDIYFLDSDSPTATVVASGTDLNSATGLPFEDISVTGTGTLHVAIIKVSGADRMLSYLNFGSPIPTIASAEYNVAPTVSGHPKAAGAFSTGAAFWLFVPTAANMAKEAVVESFSSYGGRDIVLAPDGSRLVVPDDRSKPDAVSSDGDNNTFFGTDAGEGDPSPNFFGTSAAAPNAAAVAALMIEAAGGALSPTAIYGTLEATAEDLADVDATNPDTGPGFDDRSGNGFIRADRAVAAVALPKLDVLLNELDTDQAGTDGAEFVELTGSPTQALDGLVLVGVNGTSDADYLVVDLDGEALGADGLHVTCGGTVAGCDLDDTPNTNYIQNDAEAMVLALGEAFDYDNGRFEIPPAVDVLDVLLHASGGSTADAPDAGLILALGETVTYDEAIGGDSEVHGLSRLNGAAHTGGASTLFYPLPPTPGAANAEVFTVAETDLADLAGFRLLASPMDETRTAGGVDVVDVTGGTAVGQLAAIDMVQGVAAGGAFPAEYPGADDVLFSSYDGSTYGSPATTADVLALGRGFFWYWFDTDFGPVAGGTSASHDVPTIDLSLGGIPHEDDHMTSALPETSDGFYMLGNPFPYALGLDGIGTTSMGVFSTSFLTYDPDGNTFDTRTSGDDVAALQGFFAQITSGPGSGGTGGTPAFTFSASAIDADLRSPDGDFSGLRVADPRITFRLEGAMASGARLADGAAMVRLLPDGTEGFDRHDLSKLSPPGDRILLAPVGVRNGAPHRQAVLSLPEAFEGDVPVAFASSLDGEVTLTWSLPDLPADLPVTLADVVTGTVLDLRAIDRYTFETGAADWVDRFRLRLGDDLATAIEDPDLAAHVGLMAPNPATGVARLAVRLGEAGTARVTVVDVLGRRVAVPFDGALAAGAERMIEVDASGLAPGAYFVRVVGPGVAETRRLSVVR